MNDLANIDIQSKDPLAIRARINELERTMLEAPQVPIEPIHHFAEGIYAREILIPRGTLLTGKIHKTEHLNIISQGDISVLTEDGWKRIKAPFTMVSSPGTRRLGYAHEDTVWTTIHVTNERDLDKLEAEIIAKHFDDVEVLDERTIHQLQEAL